MTGAIVFISALAYLAIWLAGFRMLLKNKGLDPSLAILADPLSHNNYRGYKVLAMTGILLCLLDRNIAAVASVVLITAAMIQIVLLYTFGRESTQPVIYFMLSFIIGIVLLWPTVNNAALASAFFLIQELYLIYWRRHQKRIYNKWVSRRALKFNRRYQDILQSLDPQTRYWVTHIATTEIIARPAIVRTAERLYYKFRRPAYISTGIMQVRHHEPVSDKDSLLMGIDIVKNILKKSLNRENEIEKLATVAFMYNGSNHYQNYLLSTKEGVRNAWLELNTPNK
jgi:hypothetical protein